MFLWQIHTSFCFLTSWRDTGEKANPSALGLNCKATTVKGKQHQWRRRVSARKTSPGRRGGRAFSCCAKCRVYRPPFRKMMSVGSTEVFSFVWFFPHLLVLFCTFLSFSLSLWLQPSWPPRNKLRSELCFVKRKAPQFSTCRPDRITAPNPAGTEGGGNEKTLLSLQYLSRPFNFPVNYPHSFFFFLGYLLFCHKAYPLAYFPSGN